jgi:3' terminal RNA ribose 2'-O-methyltransferase Hen1
MLLTITNLKEPATDIGFLLHKNPVRCQDLKLNFGKAYVFYPEATRKKCTAALLLDIDPISMVRGKEGSRTSGPLSQYVNDRPYVASSFLSVAITKVFGSALGGSCKHRPELVKARLPLTAKISVLPCRGGEKFLYSLFEPLGYKITATRHSLDEVFQDWGESVYYTIELEKETTVQELLTHIYVLVPVLDNSKHYYVGQAELENLLSKGEGWLAKHPQREIIAKRYLKFRISLAREALARLTEEDDPEIKEYESAASDKEEELEKNISLNEQRLGAVLAVIKSSDAKRILDLGCGEGRLLRELIQDKSFIEIVGVDVSVRSLEIAHKRLGLERLPDQIKNRIKLLHGSLMYRDKRFTGYDVAAVVEVIEHLDPPRLAAFERVLFEYAKPKKVILTTPNREYNVMWENMSETDLRHKDHRFEWSREEFNVWANNIAEKYGYSVHFLSVGPEVAKIGAPTQMGVFTREN